MESLGFGSLFNRYGCPCGTHSFNSVLSRAFKLSGGPRLETKHVVGSVWRRSILLPWKFQRKGSGFFLESPRLTLARGNSRFSAGRQGAHEKRSPTLVRSTL